MQWRGVRIGPQEAGVLACACARMCMRARSPARWPAAPRAQRAARAAAGSCRTGRAAAGQRSVWRELQSLCTSTCVCEASSQACKCHHRLCASPAPQPAGSPARARHACNGCHLLACVEPFCARAATAASTAASPSRRDDRARLSRSAAALAASCSASSSDASFLFEYTSSVTRCSEMRFVSSFSWACRIPAIVSGLDWRWAPHSACLCLCNHMAMLPPPVQSRAPCVSLLGVSPPSACPPHESEP